jgi:enoyl-CoA hydratase
MSQQQVDLVRSGGIATITLSNPPAHTLTASGVEQLHGLLDELEKDRSLRVLSFVGGGEGVFIAHYEVGELAAGAEANQAGEGPASSAEPQLHAMHRLCLRLERLHVPTVAALNGNAAGGGFELALACDFRLASKGPFGFGLPETTVGIIPGAGGTQRMTRLLGTAKALDLILHGRIVSPEEALEFGLIHRLFEGDAFREEANAFLEDLASRAPVALAAAKRAIHAGASLEMEEALALEQTQFNRTMRSKDAATAMRAWLKGEAWKWSGE